MQRKRAGQRSAVLGPVLPSMGDFSGSVNLSGLQLPHLSNGGGMDFTSSKGLSSTKTVILLVFCQNLTDMKYKGGLGILGKSNRTGCIPRNINNSNSYFS